MNNVTALRTFLTRKTTNSASRELGRSYWDILRANLFSFFNIILFAVSVILVIFGRYNDAFIRVSAGLAGTVVNAFARFCYLVPGAVALLAPALGGWFVSLKVTFLHSTVLPL